MDLKCDVSSGMKLVPSDERKKAIEFADLNMQ